MYDTYNIFLINRIGAYDVRWGYIGGLSSFNFRYRFNVYNDMTLAMKKSNSLILI